MESKPTDKNQAVIYCAYPRSHTKDGKLEGVTNDLQRIKDLGADYIWLLPIHPIGKLHRKGKLGSPYSIEDYSKINPEYGTMDDFKAFVAEAHKLNLKVMMDIVYNHTSHDSIILKKHPNWYHRDKNGKPYASVPKWTDIIDLDFSNPASGLWEYLIENLIFWVNLGVDSFRCDVAWIVPLEFWRKAKEEVSKVNPNILWLAETFTPLMVEIRKNKGEVYHTDSEMMQVFDMVYDYDYWLLFKKVLQDKSSPNLYLQMLRYQSTIFPKGYCKLRFVENHDQERALWNCSNENMAKAWTAFIAFNEGAFLIHGGIESKEKHKQSLFEKEIINWSHYEWKDFITKLANLKKLTSGKFTILSSYPITAIWYNGEKEEGYFGYFNVEGISGRANCCVKDGTYESHFGNGPVRVSEGKIFVTKEAEIFYFKGKLTKGVEPIPSIIFDPS